MHKNLSRVSETIALGNIEFLMTELQTARLEHTFRAPQRFQVVILDEGIESEAFLLSCFCVFFHKSLEEAQELLEEMQQQGKVVCGTYSHDVAFTKQQEVLHITQEKNHPLRCMLVPCS